MAERFVHETSGWRMLPLMTAARKHASQPDPVTAGQGDGLAFRKEWQAEVERRAANIRSGRVKGIPVVEAEAEIDAELGWD